MRRGGGEGGGRCNLATHEVADVTDFASTVQLTVWEKTSGLKPEDFPDDVKERIILRLL